MMEIRKVREVLAPIVLDHSRAKPTDEAIRGISIALLHMAEGIEELRIAVGRMSRAPLL